MIVHTTTYHAGEETTYDEEYSHSDPHATHWGKYDSAFHAWLVECVEADDYCGDTDYGGAVLYGRFVDYWTSTGFHSLVRCESREEARTEYEAWCLNYQDENHEHEYPCWVCGVHNHCGCICGIREDGTYGPTEET